MSYFALRAVHVFCAVAGIGPFLAIGPIAWFARAHPSETLARGLTLTLRWCGTALLVMLITGVALDAQVDGSFHQQWWFRLAVLGAVGIGYHHGRAARSLRATPTPDVLAQVAKRGFVMGALVLVVLALMVLKPA